jgi:hypothetical protein
MCKTYLIKNLTVLSANLIIRLTKLSIEIISRDKDKAEFELAVTVNNAILNATIIYETMSDIKNNYGALIWDTICDVNYSCHNYVKSHFADDDNTGASPDLYSTFTAKITQAKTASKASESESKTCDSNCPADEHDHDVDDDD